MTSRPRVARPFGRALAAAALALMAALQAAPAAAAEQNQRPPNIIFIMADDLGYGDLGCYGQEKIRTPHLDRMAAEGMRFTQFYAGSTVCAPSRCVLMTGYNTGSCFIRGNGKDNLRPQDVTVAEVLKPAGYQAALVGKWGLGHEGSTGVPTKQGFDYFYGYLDQHHAHNHYPAYLIRNEERVTLRNEVPEGRWPHGAGVATKKVDYSHDLMTEEALGFVDRAKDGPFFLYLAYTLPHANNEAGNKGQEVPDYGPYAEKDWPQPEKGTAAMITRMDADIGKLLARLKEHGIDENTIVFFTSDNGPHREGGRNPDFFDSNGPLNGIKRDLTDGGIRVPLIVRWPGHVPAGTTSDYIGSFADVMPTCAELAGTTQEVPDAIQGLSFAPTLLGQPEKQQQHQALYWAFYERGGAQAVRMGPWKAVQQPYNSPIRLYNVEEDIGETTNVAAQHPEVVARAKKAMDLSYQPSERWQFPKPKK